MREWITYTGDPTINDFGMMWIFPEQDTEFILRWANGCRKLVDTHDVKTISGSRAMVLVCLRSHSELSVRLFCDPEYREIFDEMMILLSS